jgi:tRNA threonylcarbamoyladenosine biosynthesis protein TsaB
MPSPPFPLLALDASGRVCSALLLAADGALGVVERSGQTGEAAFLPRMVADLLAEAGMQASDLGTVAVNVGPGSFTGLRASIAFASGLATGAGLPLIPVTTAEALAFALPEPHPPLWCALDARQGRIFLHRGGAPSDWTVALLADPPHPPSPVALTGDGATALAAALGLSDTAVTIARLPHAEGVGRAAVARAAGELGPLPTVPLYIDPPRALLPRGGLRPPPATAPPAPR